MSRFEEIGTFLYGAKYTKPLSDNTLFPMNTPLDKKLFKTFAVGDYVPEEFIVEEVYQEKGNLTFAIKNTSKYTPILYRLNGQQPGTWFLWQMEIDNYPVANSLPSYNGINEFGYEQNTSKGRVYQYFNPIVNYNPNKIVIEPYLCETYNDPNYGTQKYTFLPTQNSLEDFDSNYHILHLDDIVNDAILQAANIENRKYELKYRIIYYNQGFFTGENNTTGARPFLAHKPMIFEKPTLHYPPGYPGGTEGELFTAKDTMLPIDYMAGTLVGTNYLGRLFSDHAQWVAMSRTSYCEIENYNLERSRNLNIENAHPYLKFSSLSGANREIYKQMIKTVSSLGYAFVTSLAATNDVWRNDGITDELLDRYPNSILYPVIDKSTGKVTDTVGGEGAKTTPLKRMGDEGENPFDELPVVDPDDLDENEYVDEIPIKTELPVNPTDVFQSRYAMSNLDLNDFASYLWTSDTSIISRTLDGLKFNGENPMDFILSLKMFPFELTRYADHSPTHLQFGNAVDTGIVVERLSNANIIIELGEIDFRKYFKNFLDYEPYTTAKLYIPYCGEITVETALFVGHKIKITMIVDIITGACCAVIYRDGIPCLYANGNMSVDIQVTGQNMTEYVNATMNMINREASDIGSIATFGFSGGSRASESLHPTSTDQSKMQNSANETKQIVQGTGGIIGSIADGLTTAYEWNNTPTALAICGASSDLINWYKPQYAYFVIEQPVTMPASDYGNQYGYACFDFGRLPNKGLVVCNNAHVQPPNATEPETTEINNLLNTGVWI